MAKKSVSLNLSSDVSVKLAGADYDLRVSLKAATAISRQFGGMNNAFSALGRADLDTYTFIIKAGLAPEAQRELSDNDVDVADAVWRAGMDNLAEPLSRYVSLLRNGGRDPEAIAVDDEESEKNDGIHV
jgi:hypothetical protein